MKHFVVFNNKVHHLLRKVTVASTLSEIKVKGEQQCEGGYHAEGNTKGGERRKKWEVTAEKKQSRDYSYVYSLCIYIHGYMH